MYRRGRFLLRRLNQCFRQKQNDFLQAGTFHSYQFQLGDVYLIGAFGAAAPKSPRTREAGDPNCAQLRVVGLFPVFPSGVAIVRPVESTQQFPVERNAEKARD